VVQNEPPGTQETPERKTLIEEKLCGSLRMLCGPLWPVNVAHEELQTNRGALLKRIIK
jgi:hypothetical protein